MKKKHCEHCTDNQPLSRSLAIDYSRKQRAATTWSDSHLPRRLAASSAHRAAPPVHDGLMDPRAAMLTGSLCGSGTLSDSAVGGAGSEQTRHATGRQQHVTCLCRSHRRTAAARSARRRLRRLRPSPLRRRGQPSGPRRCVGDPARSAGDRQPLTSPKRPGEMKMCARCAAAC